MNLAVHVDDCGGQKEFQSILVVDDESSGVAFLVETLQDFYDIKVARSGKQALKILAQDLEQGDLPDLILLDVVMPDMSGFEAYLAMRALDASIMEIPAIFVTASNDLASELQALEIGGSDFIGKPLKRPIVLARVNLHLSLRQKQLELTALNHKLERNLVELDRLNQANLYAAHHDELTGLPNRVLFFDRLYKALLSLQRRQERLALLLIDLDKFKPINDQYGHAAGDAVLTELAHRMRACVRETDTVGRIGGDEFVVLLENIQSATYAQRVAEKIRDALHRPIQHGELTLMLSGSIGGILVSDPLSQADELMKEADAAMYLAKRKGGNDCLFIKE